MSSSSYFQGAPHSTTPQSMQSMHQMIQASNQVPFLPGVRTNPSGQQNHYHPLQLTADQPLCCVRHAIELCNFYKNNNRHMEAGDLIAQYLSNILQQRNGGTASLLTTVLSDESLDINQLKSLFLICNEHSARFTVQCDFEKASFLLDCAETLLNGTILCNSGAESQSLKATLYSNISCYYEKLNNDQKALFYLDQALQISNHQGVLQLQNEDFQNLQGQNPLNSQQDASEVIAAAISYNNLSVISLKQGNISEAMKAAKKAVLLMEPHIQSDIKSGKVQNERDRQAFQEKIQVLLIAYFNLAISTDKMGNTQYAFSVFQHGFKQSTKYLGEDHYFTAKFARKIFPETASYQNRLGVPGTMNAQNDSVQQFMAGQHSHQLHFQQLKNYQQSQNQPLQLESSQNQHVKMAVNNPPPSSNYDESTINVVQKHSKRKIFSISSKQQNNNSREEAPHSYTSGASSNQSHTPSGAHQQLSQNIGQKPSQLGGGGGSKKNFNFVQSNATYEQRNEGHSGPSSATGTSGSGIKDESPGMGTVISAEGAGHSNIITAANFDQKLREELEVRQKELFKQLEEQFKVRQVELEREQENKYKEIIQSMQQVQIPPAQQPHASAANSHNSQHQPSSTPTPAYSAQNSQVNSAKGSASIAAEKEQLMQQQLQNQKAQFEAELKRREEELRADAARKEAEQERRWRDQEATREIKLKESEERSLQVQTMMKQTMDQMSDERKKLIEMMEQIRVREEQHQKELLQRNDELNQLKIKQAEMAATVAAQQAAASASKLQSIPENPISSSQAETANNFQPIQSVNTLMKQGTLKKQPSNKNMASLNPMNQLSKIAASQNSAQTSPHTTAAVTSSAGAGSQTKTNAQPEQQSKQPNLSNGQQKLSTDQSSQPTSGIRISTVSKHDSSMNTGGPSINLKRGDTLQSQRMAAAAAASASLNNSTVIAGDQVGTAFVPKSMIIAEESNDGASVSLNQSRITNQKVTNSQQAQATMIKDIRKGDSIDVTKQIQTQVPDPQAIQVQAPIIPLRNNDEELKVPSHENSTLTSQAQVEYQSKPQRAQPAPLQAFTFEQINQIVEEDSMLYDASILLKNDKILAQLKTPRTVSQVIYCDGLYYKMYCQGSLGQDGKPMFKIFGICEDPKIQVQEEELSFFEIKSIFKLLIVKDVLPPHVPLRNVRTFQDLCRYFVFPFMNVDGNAGSRDDIGADSSSGALRQDSGRGGQTPGQLGSDQSNPRHVELWGRPPGLFSSQAQVILLKNRCNVSLHHVCERGFRLTITSLDIDSASSLYLDLVFDESSFEKFFQYVETSEIFKNHANINLVDHEIRLKSLKIVDKDFLYDIEIGLHAFETYLLNEFGPNITFSYLFYERTGLVYQLRICDEASQQELWCLRDDLKNQCFQVSCRTLYDVRLKKHLNTQVERFHSISYQQLWIIFGISISSLTATASVGSSALTTPNGSKRGSLPLEEIIDRSQLIMLGGMLLHTLFLHMPTMELNKGDAEDSDYEEEVNISMRKIECVVHMRKLLDVNGDKVPLTIQLLGFDNKHNSQYLGIKVVAYNPHLIKELGFFFTVNQEYWALSDEQKASIPKKRTMKTEVLHDFYHLPEVLKKQGFSYIVNNLSLKKNERVVKWKGPYGETSIDVFESYFTRSSMQ